MEKETVMERKVDYFLRYTADVPADEIDQHETFGTRSVCKPDWRFDEQNCWHTIIHKSLEK